MIITLTHFLLSPPPSLAHGVFRSHYRGGQIGSGFSGTLLSGKTHNDEFYVDEDGQTRTRTNRSGGVQGGISNGETIVVRVVSTARHGSTTTTVAGANIAGGEGVGGS